MRESSPKLLDFQHFYLTRVCIVLDEGFHDVHVTILTGNMEWGIAFRVPNIDLGTEATMWHTKRTSRTSGWCVGAIFPIPTSIDETISSHGSAYGRCFHSHKV